MKKPKFSRVLRRSAMRCHAKFVPFAVMAVFAVATIASPVLLNGNIVRADSCLL